MGGLDGGVVGTARQRRVHVAGSHQSHGASKVLCGCEYACVFVRIYHTDKDADTDTDTNTDIPTQTQTQKQTHIPSGSGPRPAGTIAP